jgi:hypothetical protein
MAALRVDRSRVLRHAGANAKQVIGINLKNRFIFVFVVVTRQTRLSKNSPDI